MQPWLLQHTDYYYYLVRSAGVVIHHPVHAFHYPAERARRRAIHSVQTQKGVRIPRSWVQTWVLLERGMFGVLFTYHWAIMQVIMSPVYLIIVFKAEIILTASRINSSLSMLATLWRYLCYVIRHSYVVAKISAVSRKLVQPKRTVKQNVLRGKMSISTSG